MSKENNVKTRVLAIAFLIGGFLISYGVGLGYKYIVKYYDFTVSGVMEKILLLLTLIPFFYGAAYCLHEFKKK